LNSAAFPTILSNLLLPPACADVTAPHSSAEEIRPLSPGEVSRILADRFLSDGRGVRIVGGRTSVHPVDDDAARRDVLSTAGLNRVLDYPADDMTITLEAGVRVEELQETLQAQHQRLPVDIPEARRATIGGAIACNVSGPGRYGHGTLRDYLIGVRAVDGRGRVFAAGGRVVKNVAGYDLCKLLVGSAGRLAVITEVTLKLRPLAESRSILWAGFDSFDSVEHALAQLLTSAARPVAVELLNPLAAEQLAKEARVQAPVDRPVLGIACEGTPLEADWQMRTLSGEMGLHLPKIVRFDADAAARLWSALREYQCASDDPVSFQASMKPSRVVEWTRMATDLNVAVQCHAGNGIAVGHIPDTCTTSDAAAKLLTPLSAMAHAAGGSVEMLQCDPTWRRRLAAKEQTTAATRLMADLKEALDPRGLLNPLH
jgi:glycolate oxidase FAD binding subunit